MSKLLPRMALGLVLGLVVIGGLAVLGDPRQVAGALARFYWPYVPLILALTLFNYALRFVKWHFYVRQIGARDLAWRDSLRIFVAGFPLALSPGKLAEPLKAVWLNRYTGVPVARAIPVVAAERISDGLAVLLLSTFGVVAYPQYWPAFLGVLAVLLGVALASQIRPLALWLLGIGERLPLVARFVHHLHEFYEGLYQLLGPRSLLVAVGLGVISWLGEGLGFYLVLLGLGVAPGVTAAALAVFVLAFSTIVGGASAMPGGLGAAEGAIVGLLALALNLPRDIAVSAALLIRLFTLWFGVALGALVLALSKRLWSFEF
jgi:uncharacterized protein (TIRG00374 family)